jgi:hypothetical protein
MWQANILKCNFDLSVHAGNNVVGGNRTVVPGAEKDLKGLAEARMEHTDETEAGLLYTLLLEAVMDINPSSRPLQQAHLSSLDARSSPAVGPSPSYPETFIIVKDQSPMPVQRLKTQRHFPHRRYYCSNQVLLKVLSAQAVNRRK